MVYYYSSFIWHIGHIGLQMTAQQIQQLYKNL